ncbi:MAG: 1-deoxy-D-xylulose-5-phosphate reductoisomerase [Deltaproteobacteria bacterium]|jgi:1-deoxy-D-xylulose-5-phosphate reductoisomerase|nr:1-deoxy-D-xylulose-5-phosphate reductoisomerase [Deltaproteobacteria bacterium]
MKRLAILGSTGSIGVSTLEIIAEHPNRFQVVALTAGRNLELLAEQIERFRPEYVAVLNSFDADQLHDRFGTGGPHILHGTTGLVSCAADTGADMVVSAIVGAAGLEPTLAAIESGKDVALANKETLVVAGRLVMRAVARHGCHLFPVDSEHSAIFQSLQGHRKADVKRLILTASGGPFRNHALEDLAKVSAEDALAHPNWTMGRKISVDSATMMNKGLEVIEAHWLFALPADRIDVHIHPESIVHSMVEYVDGAVIAQLGIPDMKTPIAYALSFPERMPLDLPPLDLCERGLLQFEKPDFDRFPCLGLAYSALRKGGTAPAVMNAANEIAVEAFLSGQIGFMNIAEIIQSVMDQHHLQSADTLQQVLSADAWARQVAVEHVMRIESEGVK